MDHYKIIEQLNAHRNTFSGLLENKIADEYLWKSRRDTWCLLEIVCHLYDEEREDFRARVRHTLETPNEPLPLFDQIAWVTDRKYIEQDYNEMVRNLLAERELSVTWLKSLISPPWKNAHHHPKLGPMSAEHFLMNWLAHDLLHIRQIVRLQFQFLQQSSKNDLSYAGSW